MIEVVFRLLLMSGPFRVCPPSAQSELMVTLTLESPHLANQYSGVRGMTTHSLQDLMLAHRDKATTTKAHEMAAIMAVLEFPPNDSFSNQVKIESRYGTKSSFFFFPLTASLA